MGDKVIPIHHYGRDDVVQSFVASLEGEDVAIKHGDSGFVDTSLEKFWVTLDSNVWWSVVRQPIMVPTR
jgi:hypothetical protein